MGSNPLKQEYSTGLGLGFRGEERTYIILLVFVIRQPSHNRSEEDGVNMFRFIIIDFLACKVFCLVNVSLGMYQI